MLSHDQLQLVDYLHGGFPLVDRPFAAVGRAMGWSEDYVIECLRQLLASGVACECRTTWHAGLFGVEALVQLADTLASEGVTHWALQECRAPGAQAWSLTAQQTVQLGARFTEFVVRRG